MKKKIFYFFLLILLNINNSFAQNNTNRYTAVDAYTTKLGFLESLNVARIADTLTRKLVDKEQKARAIFFWIAHNISLDARAIKSNDQRKSAPEDVVKQRKATPLGFAKLFQEMSSQANIRCLVVDGYAKNNTENINNPADEINHSWNVVQLGQSPDQWFFVDAAKASGFNDKKFSNFTPDFTPNYFFAEKALFNLDHYPDNSAWQLGGGSKSLKDFYALPVIARGAYAIGLKKPIPVTGFIKTKIKNKVLFSFTCNKDIVIQNVSLMIGEGKKMQKPEPMNFTASNGLVNFSYQFKTDDNFPVKIIVDGKEMLQYMVEVTE